MKAQLKTAEKKLNRQKRQSMVLKNLQHSVEERIKESETDLLDFKEEEKLLLSGSTKKKVLLPGKLQIKGTVKLTN